MDYVIVEEDNQYDNSALYVLGTILLIIWVALGIAAFIMSLVCFGYSGTLAQQVVGLLIAVFFGPFYWIYYLVVKTYCNKLPIRKKK